MIEAQTAGPIAFQGFPGAYSDLACRAEVWDRCINTSERTKGVMDMEQRFPMPFKAAVVARA